MVIFTGAGSNQRGVPEGYRLRGHHWPACWITSPTEDRDGELFIAGELLAGGGRVVIEVMLHEAAHALAASRGIKDTSAEGNRYHNKRFVALAEELGLRGPDRPENVAAGQTAASPARPPGTTTPPPARSMPEGSRTCPASPPGPAPAKTATAGKTAAPARTRARASPASAAAAGSPSSAPASQPPASCT